MADWASIRRYAATGSTTGVTAFEQANPGLSTGDLRQFQREYPQVTVAGRALARRQREGSAPSGTPTQRGDATGPLQTPEPTPGAPDRTQVGPEPNRMGPPAEGPGPAKTIIKHLKALDDRAAVIPTPGDLGPWILALLFLVTVVVTFNGHTRLQLLWYALTGAAYVPPLNSAANLADRLANAAQGASGGTSGAGTVGGGGGSINQPAGSGSSGSGAGTTPKQEAPGGFTPRRVVGGSL